MACSACMPMVSHTVRSTWSSHKYGSICLTVIFVNNKSFSKLAGFNSALSICKHELVR